ncbi:MAG: HIT family protein [Candidatus Aenigmarchaeota archaeon]|nr:HIT family protein [Candidatus Aenigmarchaeota archaeon]
MEPQDIFCKIARGEIKSDKILEYFNWMVLPAIDPVVDPPKYVQLLVAPKGHYPDFQSLPEYARNSHDEVIFKMLRALERSGMLQGYLIESHVGKASGASFPDHFHTHIITLGEGCGREYSTELNRLKKYSEKHKVKPDIAIINETAERIKQNL